ncbi:hypothetical protein EIP91_005931 [Steccherinum ochraceum]|uniref:Uncharacterized protein n=1 Tax=Steccherinum ochraceum TaxID=92696 RepID=A0A4R0S1A7_9APHY|nr:hypothetical protein EIP91_005931 [Steccherinum ochraceum]
MTTLNGTGPSAVAGNAGLNTASTASLADMYIVRDELERIKHEFARVQDLHILAIQKAEEEKRETMSRVGKLEEQVAFLMTEIMEMRKGKGRGSPARRSLGSPKVGYEGHGGGSPSRRTEPRKLLASPGSVHSFSSAEERKILASVKEIMSLKNNSAPHQAGDRGSSPEEYERLSNSSKRKSSGKGKEKMVPKKQDAADNTEVLPMHVESSQAARRKTVTPIKRAPAQAQPANEGTAHPLPQASDAKGKGRALPEAYNEEAKVDQGQPPDAVIDSDDDMVVTASEGSSTDDETINWQFSGEGVPKCALQKTEGPFERYELEELFGLETDTLGDLDRFPKLQRPRFRVLLCEKLAFIYDPLMLEAGPDSLIVGWCNPKQKHHMRQYMMDHGREHGECLHTFAHPRQKDGWWYLGYLQWGIYDDIFPIWPTCKRDSERRAFLGTLADSYNHVMPPEEIQERLEDGRLVQFTAHVQRPSDFRKKTKEFIAEELQNPRDDEVRILTLFSLLVLVSHSFVPAYAADPDAPNPATPTDVATPPASPTPPTDTPPANTPPANTPPANTPPVNTPPATTTHVTTPKPPPSSPPSSPPPASTPHNSSPAKPSNPPTDVTTADPPSTTEGSSTSDAISNTDTDTSTPASTSSPSPTSSAAITPGTTLNAGTNANPTHNVADPSATYVVPSGTLPGIVHPTENAQDPGTVAGAASSGSGTSFFDNKGAVAGTFFAVALVVIGLIVAGVSFLKRRRRRYRHEEDEVYFEKYHEPSVQDNHSPTLGSGVGDSSHDLSTQVHARADAYPDRAIHHGWTPEAEYGNPQEYGVEYPPGTAYGNAQAQQAQYQYNGGGGTAYANASQGYLTAARKSPGPHPFADPHNASRAPAAPPVGYSRSTESHYSNQSAYSGTAY